MNKLSLVDRAVFRGFADKVLKAIEDGSDDELLGDASLLRQDRTGPAKDARPPRAAYARQETSRSLVDHIINKSAT